MRERLTISLIFSSLKPGVRRGIIRGDKKNETIINNTSPPIIKLTIDEIFFDNSSRLFLYLIKIGIKAEVRAPVINTSKIKSGRRNDERKMSNSSFEKKVAKVR